MSKRFMTLSFAVLNAFILSIVTAFPALASEEAMEEAGHAAANTAHTLNVGMHWG